MPVVRSIALNLTQVLSREQTGRQLGAESSLIQAAAQELLDLTWNTLQLEAIAPSQRALYSMHAHCLVSLTGSEEGLMLLEMTPDAIAALAALCRCVLEAGTLLDCCIQVGGWQGARCICATEHLLCRLTSDSEFNSGSNAF